MLGALTLRYSTYNVKVTTHNFLLLRLKMQSPICLHGLQWEKFTHLLWHRLNQKCNITLRWSNFMLNIKNGYLCRPIARSFMGQHEGLTDHHQHGGSKLKWTLHETQPILPLNPCVRCLRLSYTSEPLPSTCWDECVLWLKCRIMDVTLNVSTCECDVIPQYLRNEVNSLMRDGRPERTRTCTL